MSIAVLVTMSRTENCLRCVIDPYLAGEVLIPVKETH
jgi:hypothetical protein